MAIVSAVYVIYDRYGNILLSVPLDYNNESGKYESTFTAPIESSFKQSGGKYSGEVVATSDEGNSATERADLIVMDDTVPTGSITSPSSGAQVSDCAPVITAVFDVATSGINQDSIVLKIDGVERSYAGLSVTHIQDNDYEIELTPTHIVEDGTHTYLIEVTSNDGYTGGATATISILTGWRGYMIRFEVSTHGARLETNEHEVTFEAELGGNNKCNARQG